MATCPGVLGTYALHRSSRSKPIELLPDGLCKDCHDYVSAEKNESSQNMPTFTGSAQGEDIVFDSVLGYLAAWRDSCRKSDLVHLVSNHFDSMTIENAKKVLWSSSSANDV